MAMKLSTGKIAFPIEFDNGDVQNIYFNPSDPELGERLIRAKDIISNRLEKQSLGEIELSNSGEPVDIKKLKNMTEEEITELLEKTEKTRKAFAVTKQIICEELDRAFDSDVSSVIFKYCSPFAIVGGNYFILNFFDAVAPEIEKCINSSNKEFQKRMQKHIGKYAKK